MLHIPILIYVCSFSILLSNVSYCYLVCLPFLLLLQQVNLGFICKNLISRPNYLGFDGFKCSKTFFLFHDFLRCYRSKALNLAYTNLTWCVIGIVWLTCIYKGRSPVDITMDPHYLYCRLQEIGTKYMKIFSLSLFVNYGLISLDKMALPSIIFTNVVVQWKQDLAF